MPRRSCQVTKDGNHGRNAKGGTYWQWLNKAHLAILAASDMFGPYIPTY